MKLVTAAYGQRYLRYASGLARSVTVASPGLEVVVFCDRPPAEDVRGAHFEPWVPGATLDPGDHPAWGHKVRVLLEAVRRWGEACWIDSDVLVFEDLPSVLRAGSVNAVAYGAPGGLRRCGGGLSVPQQDFLLGALYSMTEDLAPFWEDRLRQIPLWSDPGEDVPGILDMKALAHLAHAHAARIHRLDREHPMAVWGLEWGGGHPMPGNRDFSAVIGRDGRLWKGDRPIATLLWTSSALEGHLSEDFRAVRDFEARRILSSFYLCAP